MVRRDAGDLKKERLHGIRKKIVVLYNKTKKPINVEKFLDWIELDVGLKRSTARDYLDLILRSMVDFEYSRDGKEIIVTGKTAEGGSEK